MDISIEFQKELIATLVALSQEKHWTESPFAIGLLTAGSAILAAVLQRWQAYKLQERESEIEKKLRLHSLQIDALKALSLVAHNVTPNSEPSPGADTHEWLTPIVHELSTVIKQLDIFLKDHAHLSPPRVVAYVKAAINIANDHKWGVLQTDEQCYDPNEKEIKGVLDLIGKLEDAVNEFKQELGVSTA